MSKKNYFSLFLIFGILLFISPDSFSQSKVLSNGSTAPMFTSKASLSGNEFEFSLKKALAKGPVVLYFYPAADDIQRLKTFSSDPDFCAGKFPVASDPGGKIAATYGLELVPPQAGVKDVKGQPVTHGFIPRTTFVINKNDKIVAVFSSKTDHISPDEHVKKSLAIVSKM
jgi:peroxiredoxin